MRRVAAFWGAVALAVLGCGGSNRISNGDASGSGRSADAALLVDAGVGADAAIRPDAAGDGACSSQAVALNVASVRVHGTVTLNGGPYPASNFPYVRLYFNTAETTPVALSATGTYEVSLAPGRYDVVVAQSTCVGQCYYGTVGKGVDITAEGEFDFDLVWDPPSLVAVDGTVTLNGAPITSASGPAPYVTFVDGTGATIALAPILSDDGAFTTSLIPGVYSVRYYDGANVATGSPCDGPVLTGQVVVEDHPLALDFKTAVLKGHITVDGKQATATTGALVAADQTSQLFCAVVPQSDGAYAFDLNPGHYDLTWQGDNQSCAGPFPCNSGVLQADVIVDGSSYLDLDVRAIHVRGDVTVNGAPMPDDVDTRGTLMIGQVPNNFGTAGPASYDVVLFPGTYDVMWMPSTYFHQAPKADVWFCTNGGQATPCNDGMIQPGVPFFADGTKDIDIPVVHVHGVVTKNGAPIPEVTVDRNAGARGVVAFARPDGIWRAEIPIPDTGTASYEASLLGGAAYVQSWAPGITQRYKGGCEVEHSLGLPCQEGTLRTSLTLRADGVLDAPLETFRLAGHLTLDGGAWSGPAPYGIGFTAPPGSLSPDTSYPLTPGPDGLAFDVELPKGAWVPVVIPPPINDACAAPSTEAPYDSPCNREILVPCWH